MKNASEGNKIAVVLLDDVLELLGSSVSKLSEIKTDDDEYKKHLGSKKVGIRFSITKIEEYIRAYNLRDCAERGNDDNRNKNNK